MGGEISKLIPDQIERIEAVSSEKKILSDHPQNSGNEFPGYDFHPPDRKNWMLGLGPENVQVNKIIWPGTHDSATDKIGIPAISRPFAQCQYYSLYHLLEMGTRFLDIRIQEDRRVCHGPLSSYLFEVVIDDVKKFLSETQSEIIIMEIRTEFGKEDPSEFDKYLVEQLGELLVHQNDDVFEKTIADILPRRIICVWKPRKTTESKRGGPLWSGEYLKDNWIDTDLPWTKFESNMKFLSEQPPVISRKFFYRVENTDTTS